MKGLFSFWNFRLLLDFKKLPSSKKVAILIVTILAWTKTSGQELNSLRCVVLKGNKSIIELPEDEIIVWESIKQSHNVPIRIDSVSKEIEFLNIDRALPDSIQVCYRVVSPSSFKDYGGSLSEYKDEYIAVETFDERQKNEKKIVGETIFGSDKVNKSGSLSRGVLFGNRQNLVVNSALNLQLDGKLSNKLNIIANITDQNLPYQPEGNTQNLQDLDNVFVKLYSEKFALTAGDIVFKNRNSHFLKYLKNVQGGQLDYSFEGENNGFETKFGASISKGKFASVNVAPIDGVQGPYQISVPESGSFTVILANSEKVFVDGKQLERGYDRDYIIDYNLAEITFTTKVVITGFSRIRVDVEYSDQNYNRSIVAFKQKVLLKSTALDINFYQEKDNKRRPLRFGLSQSDQERLSLAGDDMSLAAISSIDSSQFENNSIRYEIVDTIVNGQPYNALVFSTDPDKAKYTASFSNIGLMKGNYIRRSTTANGPIFQWVAPVGGVPQGDFSPVISITTPNMKQVASVEVKKRTGRHEFKSEIAFSHRDDNLFSTIDDSDNIGQAVMLDYRFNNKLGGILGYDRFYSNLHYELLTKDFNGIDRFREVDFDRSWGISRVDGFIPGRDQLAKMNIGFNGGFGKKFSYVLSTRNRGEVVEGLKHELLLRRNGPGFQYNVFAAQTDNSSDRSIARWSRVETDVSYHHFGLTPGYVFELDQSARFSDVSRDSVISTPLHFFRHGVYIEQGDSSKVKLRLSHFMRYDKEASKGEVLDTTFSNVTELRLDKLGEKGNLNTVFSLRKIKDAQVDTLIANNLMSTIGFRQSFWNGVLNIEINYNAIQTRELQREFVFVQVSTGEGTHTWRDENSDGIQSLNEFYEAINIDERNYIKVFLPTNNYVPAFGNLLNGTITVRPKYSSYDMKGLGAFLSRISWISTLTVDQKDDKSEFLDKINPFSSKVSSSNTLAARRLYRTRVFFNQRDPGYGADVGFTSSDRKTLLANGDEWIVLRELVANQRVRLFKNYTLFAMYKKGQQRSESEFLSDRNYDVTSDLLEGKIQWQPSGFFRLSSRFASSVKRSVISENNDRALASELGLETRWNRGGKQTVTAGYSYKNISFSGVENTALSYILLEALNPGVNQLWNVSIQMKLINGLQLSFSYNGRKSEGNKPVNIGQMRVTALF